MEAMDGVEIPGAGRRHDEPRRLRRHGRRYCRRFAMIYIAPISSSPPPSSPGIMGGGGATCGSERDTLPIQRKGGGDTEEVSQRKRKEKDEK